MVKRKPHLGHYNLKLHFYLLRGLIREKEHWGDFGRKLKDAFPEATISYLEIPGTGQLYQSKSMLDLKNVVQFCKPHYNVESRSGVVNIVICISLGGMVVSEWLKHYPEDFQGAILLNTSFKGFSSIFKRVKPRALKAFLKIAITKDIKDKEAKIIKLISNNKKNHLGILERWLQISKHRPVSVMNAVRQLWSAATFTPLKKAPKNTKVLILASTADRLCDYTCSVKIHHHWQGKIRFHQTAGHDIPIDDPKWLISHIQEFVKSNFFE